MLCKAYHQNDHAVALVCWMPDRVVFNLTCDSSLWCHQCGVSRTAWKLLLLLSERVGIVKDLLTMASIQVVTFSLSDMCVTVVFQRQQHGSKNQQPPSHHNHHDKWLPCWNGNTPEVMSQWNFSPPSFGCLHQVRGYHALTRRPTETMSCLMFSSGPLPQGLWTSFSAYFHSEILAFLLPPQQLPPLTVV